MSNKKKIQKSQQWWWWWYAWLIVQKPRKYVNTQNQKEREKKTTICQRISVQGAIYFKCFDANLGQT